MNQLHYAETGNISSSGDQAGATSGCGRDGPPPPPKVSTENPANVSIVNKYNSFNLANVTPPVAPKWKQTDTLLDEFRKFWHSCQRIFDGLMITLLVAKWKQICYWYGQVLMERTSMTVSIFYHIRNMMSTMCFSGSRNSVNQFATSGPQDLSSPKFPNTTELLIHFIIGLSNCHDCEFSDPHECLIDAIIFGTNCVKAQDKLLQTPKTLSLQQCLTACHHYESLKLHIQQIRPDKHVEFLRRHDPTKRKARKQWQSSLNRPQSWSRRNQTGQQTCSLQGKMLPSNKCIGCGHDQHNDHKCECPASRQTCRKCSRLEPLYKSVWGCACKEKTRQSG